MNRKTNNPPLLNEVCPYGQAEAVHQREGQRRPPEEAGAGVNVEILDEIVRKTKRHIAWAAEVLDALCDTDAKRQRRHTRQRELLELLEKSGGVTGDLALDH